MNILIGKQILCFCLFYDAREEYGGKCLVELEKYFAVIVAESRI